MTWEVHSDLMLAEGLYTLTFPAFHGVQGQPMLVADPHSFGTVTMTTRCR